MITFFLYIENSISRVLIRVSVSIIFWGWSGGAMVLGKLPVPGRPTTLITVGQGPTALAAGAGWVVWTFSLVCHFSFLTPSLWETARYILKYCLKGPLPPTDQPTKSIIFSCFQRCSSH